MAAYIELGHSRWLRQSGEYRVKRVDVECSLCHDAFAPAPDELSPTLRGEAAIAQVTLFVAHLQASRRITCSNRKDCHAARDAWPAGSKPAQRARQIEQVDGRGLERRDGRIGEQKQLERACTDVCPELHSDIVVVVATALVPLLHQRLAVSPAAIQRELFRYMIGFAEAHAHVQWTW